MRGRLLLATCLGLLPLLLRADGPAAAAPVTVTITQRAPIESLSSTGEVQGVTESNAGAKLTLVSVAGAQLILQDAQGARYEIAASATDYTPPPPVATPAPAPAPAVAAATPSASAPAPAPAPAPTKPPEQRQIPPASPPAAPPAASTAATPSGEPFTFTMDDRAKDNVVAVYPQGGIAGRPLLMAAHGNGGTGPNEIKGWIALAKAHNFTVICPTFESSVNSSFIDSDTPYFRHILHWIEDNLQYDKSNVYMTGFSGGGCATWYFATQRADFFRGLFLQSGNFWGSIDDFHLSGWSDRPIEVIWGSNDLPNIITQGQAALEALKDAACTNVVHVVVPGAGHQEHPDMVVKWMEEQVAAASTNPSE